MENDVINTTAMTHPYDYVLIGLLICSHDRHLMREIGLPKTQPLAMTTEDSCFADKDLQFSRV